MLNADLHIHSTVSDGSDTIEEIIAQAKARRLDAIAITDHDTLAHVRRIPPTRDLKVLAGIEISAMDKRSRKKAHILGYHIQNTYLVERATRPLLEKRHTNSLRQMEALRKNGFQIDVNKVHCADGKYIYKQHIMEYLVNTNQVAEMFGIFYTCVFKGGGFCDFDIDYMDVGAAVKLIKEAGGFAVLAHSGEQQNFALIPDLVKLGLDGLEYNHPSHSEADRHMIREAAEKYGLFLTGGSDYHGRYARGNRQIGAFLAEASGADILCGPITGAERGRIRESACGT